MKTQPITATELRSMTAAFLDLVEEGKSFAVVRNGRVVAWLGPPPGERFDVTPRPSPLAAGAAIAAGAPVQTRRGTGLPPPDPKTPDPKTPVMLDLPPYDPNNPVRSR